MLATILPYLKSTFLAKLGNTVIRPANELVDGAITEASTTFFSNIIRKIKGKYQRVITIQITNRSQQWMEDALYKILARYNDLERLPHVELYHKYDSVTRKNTLAVRLPNGCTKLKYRNYELMVVVNSQPQQQSGPPHRSITPTTYTIVTYNLTKIYD